MSLSGNWVWYERTKAFCAANGNNLAVPSKGLFSLYNHTICLFQQSFKNCLQIIGAFLHSKTI